jgi:hypothetical protein
MWSVLTYIFLVAFELKVEGFITLNSNRTASQLKVMVPNFSLHTAAVTSRLHDVRWRLEPSILWNPRDSQPAHVEEGDRRGRSHYSLLERSGQEETKYSLTTMHYVNCQLILVTCREVTISFKWKFAHQKKDGVLLKKMVPGKHSGLHRLETNRSYNMQCSPLYSRSSDCRTLLCCD